jgi:predicted amidohydrolase YtcJ
MIENRPADLVLLGGSIYPVHQDGPATEAVAVTSGRIVAVGSEGEVRSVSSTKTEVLDLGGRMLLPGFNDAHVHPVSGGIERLRCDLTDCSTRDEYKEKIRNYLREKPDVPWVFGGGWGMASFPGGTPTAAELDEAVPDRPAFLFNRDHHGAWVNSRALELAAIDRGTADPADGRIERDAEGNPTGMLHEGATTLVERLLPSQSDDDLMNGLLEAQTYLLSLGITGWQDAIVGEEFLGRSTLPTYMSALEKDRLVAKVRGALWLKRSVGPDALDELIELRRKAREAGFDAGTIKIMQDGVVESFTAGMIDPYLDETGTPTSKRGMSFFDPAFLNEFCPAADAAGFQLHFHAIGDRAVRECLDAVEAARRANGMHDNRHHIAHLQVIHPQDVPRFAELGVVANAQPLWACMEPQMRELNVPFLGPERVSWQYPFGSLAGSGARLAFGSDWPISSPDPLAGIYVALNRTEAPSTARQPVDPEPLLPKERIDLHVAIAAYTLGSAYVSHRDTETGTIEVGKAADLVVLDRDLTNAAAEELDDARVDLTMIDGRVMYERTDTKLQS